MLKNDNIIKDPVGMGKKGGTNKRGSTSIKTKLKKTNSWGESEELFEKIVLEAMQSKSPSVRRKAAKDFGEFIKPKKREQMGSLKLTIEDVLDDENV